MQSSFKPISFKKAFVLTTVVIMIMGTGLFMFSSAETSIRGTRGEERRVNEAPGDEQQYNPTIAVSTDGVIYAAWEDRRLNYDVSDIFFSNSTDGGLIWSPNFIVHWELPYTTGYIQESPDLAAWGPDKVFCVWGDKRNDNDFDIYLNYSWDRGYNWSGDIRVTTDTHDQMDPQVVCPDGENLYICWVDDRNGNSSNYFQTDIYFRTYDIQGHVFTSEVRVNNDTSEEKQQNPCMTLGNNGSINIAWEDGRNGDSHINDNWDIYVGRSDDDGATFKNVKVVNESGTANQMDPSISVDPWDNIYVSWTDERHIIKEIYFSQSFNKGASFEDDLMVNSYKTDLTHERDSSILVDDKGVVYVVFIDSKDGFNLTYLVRSFDGGLSFNKPIIFDSSLEEGGDGKTYDTISNQWYYYAEMEKGNTAVDSHGNKLYCVWEDYRNDQVPMNGIPQNGNIYHNSTSLSLDPPPPPPTLQAEALSYNSIELIWTMSLDSDFHQYILYSSTSEGFNEGSTNLVETFQDRYTTSYIHTGLATDTTYYYKLRVYDLGGQKATSNEASATTLINAPPTFVFTSPSASTGQVDQEFTVSWEDNDPEENASIKVYLDTDTTTGDGTWLFNASEDPDGIHDQWLYNTSKLDDGFYYLMCNISDGFNPTVTVFSVKFEVYHWNESKIDPMIVSTYPKNGDTNVSLDTRILIEFNKPMDPTSMTNNNITIESRGIYYKADITYDPQNKTTILDPQNNLRGGVQINVSVKHTVKCVHNKFLGTKHTFSFITEENLYAPKALEVFPVEDAVDVPYDTIVWIRYDSALDATTVTSEGFSINAKNKEHKVDGFVGTVEAENKVIFTLTEGEKLLPEEIYQVRVTGYVGENGKTAEMKYWSFTTMALPPDEDYDGDGTNNSEDEFPVDPTEWNDNDKDGTGDNLDSDDDNDNFTDEQEIQNGTNPFDPLSYPQTTDDDDIDDDVESDDDSGMFGSSLVWILIIIFVLLVFVIVVVVIMKKRSAEEEDWDEDEEEDYEGEEIECPECGTLVDADELECPECGEELPEIEEDEEDDYEDEEEFVCPECGALVLPDDEECPDCGEELPEREEEDEDDYEDDEDDEDEDEDDEDEFEDEEEDFEDDYDDDEFEDEDEDFEDEEEEEEEPEPVRRPRKSRRKPPRGRPAKKAKKLKKMPKKKK